jgi:hypothetical protein
MHVGFNGTLLVGLAAYLLGGAVAGRRSTELAGTNQGQDQRVPAEAAME